MAGSPCPIEVMKEVVEKMHMKDILVSIHVFLPTSFISNGDVNSAVG